MERLRCRYSDRAEVEERQEEVEWQLVRTGQKWRRDRKRMSGRYSDRAEVKERQKEVEW